jgi:hypothetical protein
MGPLTVARRGSAWRRGEPRRDGGWWSRVFVGQPTVRARPASGQALGTRHERNVQQAAEHSRRSTTQRPDRSGVAAGAAARNLHFRANRAAPSRFARICTYTMRFCASRERPPRFARICRSGRPSVDVSIGAPARAHYTTSATADHGVVVSKRPHPIPPPRATVRRSAGLAAALMLTTNSAAPPAASRPTPHNRVALSAE